MVEIPSDAELTEGNDGQVDENEVVDSGEPSVEDEPSADNEVTVTNEENPEFAYGSENEVPIDWLKRGGSNGDPSAILYSTVGNAAPVLEDKASPNAPAREIGQDDKAAAIQTKANAAAPKFLSEKKEPIALIKKGRVFLR